MLKIQKLKDFASQNSKWILLSLLGINFFIRLIIFYTTTLFSFTDYAGYLNGIEIIKNKGSIPLINSGNYLYFNSYVGYFFKYILGSLDYYFIFNCLLGTITSYVVYLICFKLTKNKLVGLLTVFLHCIYLEFMVFSSIFYTPIIMMFLLSIIILFLIYYIKVNFYKKILIGFVIMVLVNGTYYFKGELSRLWIFLILFGMINFKRKRILIGFVLLGIMLTFSTRVLRKYNILPYNKGYIAHNNFIFFGHTLYGGDGGDGAFIYEENKQRYKKAFSEFCKDKNITRPTRKDKNNFQWDEIKKFVTHHPLKWVKLQFYKFFRFFGVVPEGNSFKILYSGAFKGKMAISAIFLVLPFVIMILLIIITFDFSRVIIGLKRPELLLLGLLFLYYIVASVFYGQYQERYRMPVMVCFLIPFLSWSLVRFNLKNLLSNRKVAVFKAGIIILLLGIWLSQTYNALVVHKKRYISTVKESTILTSRKKQNVNIRIDNIQ